MAYTKQFISKFENIEETGWDISFCLGHTDPFVLINKQVAIRVIEDYEDLLNIESKSLAFDEIMIVSLLKYGSWVIHRDKTIYELTPQVTATGMGNLEVRHVAITVSDDHSLSDEKASDVKNPVALIYIRPKADIVQEAVTEPETTKSAGFWPSFLSRLSGKLRRV